MDKPLLALHVTNDKQ
jgi:hypothetical protein